MLIDKLNLHRHDGSGVEAEIRHKLNSYLRGELSLEDFRRWLVATTWNRTDTPEVAHAIAYYIDEAASGNYSRAKMDEELHRIASTRAAEAARH